MVEGPANFFVIMGSPRKKPKWVVPTDLLRVAESTPQKSHYDQELRLGLFFFFLIDTWLCFIIDSQCFPHGYVQVIFSYARCFPCPSSTPSCYFESSVSNSRCVSSSLLTGLVQKVYYKTTNFSRKIQFICFICCKSLFCCLKKPIGSTKAKDPGFHYLVGPCFLFRHRDRKRNGSN